MRLSEVFEGFKSWAYCEYSPCTAHTYTLLVPKFLTYVDDCAASSLEEPHVTGYCATLKQRGYKSATISQHMNAVRQFVKYGYRRKLISLDFMLVPVPQGVSEHYQAIDPQTAHDLLSSIQVKDFATLRNKALLEWLYATGVRVSECARLEVSDLRLDEDEPYALIRHTSKTQEPRIVTWPPETDTLLRWYLRLRQPRAKAPQVFISVDRATGGNGLSTRSMERILERYRAFDWIKCHSMRHALGNDSVTSRIHSRITQEILGHENLGSQKIYTRVNNQDALGAYKQIHRARRVALTKRP